MKMIKTLELGMCKDEFISRVIDIFFVTAVCAASFVVA